MNMNTIWHNVAKERITPEEFLACIEISAGSSNKYELDKETGALLLDRILYTATHYPHNYGFIPRTLSEDTDPLDVLVICRKPIISLALTPAFPIGILEMNDSGALDEKIIAVCAHDPVYNSYQDISELPKHVTDEIVHFFKVYKQLETGKYTEVGNMKGREAAIMALKKDMASYAKAFPEE